MEAPDYPYGVISYAQNFEDVLLDRCFRDLSDGFYIDVGAWDPFTDSVTHHFYSKGWTGINVEPCPEFFDVLRTARPRDVNLMVAISDSDNELQEFTILSGSGVSTLRTLPDEYLANLESRGFHSDVVRVPTTTLARVCQDHVPEGKTIHFLKVDVEGWEEAVLRGHDWERWRPQVVVVESKTPVAFDEQSGKDVYEDGSQTWEHIMLKNGYVFALNDGINRFYVRDESPELLDFLRVPVNCLDQAMHHSTFQSQRELAQARLDLQSLALEIEGYKKRVESKEAEVDRANAELAAQRQRVETLLASTSWRVTSPLRRVSDLRSSKGRKGEDGRDVSSLSINIVGHFSDTSGLAEATRSTARSLETTQLRVNTLDVGPTGDGGEPRKTAWLQSPSGHAVTVVHDNIALAADQASLYRPRVDEPAYTVGYWYWELADLPLSYRSHFDLVDEVWVPSTFVRDAFRPHTKKPVTVVPPSLDFRPAPSQLRERFRLPDDRFLFLTMASVHSVLERKNPLGVIKAFGAAFRETDQVGLVVKVTDLQLRPDMVEAFREAAGTAPIYLLEDRLSRSETLGLIASVDAYVSLHRSEGLGLPIAEAMALGKATVTTAYSGNMDFTSSETAFLVGYDLVELTRSHSVYPAGFHWAEPHLESAAAEMRSVVFDVDRRDRIAAAGQQTVRTHYDASVGGRIIRNRMAAIAGS